MIESGTPFATADIIKEARARLSGTASILEKKEKEVPYMSVNEPALVHPWNQSIVKIRDNGTVDLFSGTDNGIRINPEDRTIDLISRTQNTHATFVRAFVMKDEVRYIQKGWTIWAETATINTTKNTTVNADLQCVINTKKETIVNADTKCIINTKEETIVNADKNIELNTKADFHMNAAGNAYYKAGGQHFFD